MSDKYLHTEKQQLLNNIGTEQCWGWSPAVDFTKLLSEKVLYDNCADDTHANCLDDGCADNGVVNENAADEMNNNNNHNNNNNGNNKVTKTESETHPVEAQCVKNRDVSSIRGISSNFLDIFQSSDDDEEMNDDTENDKGSLDVHNSGNRQKTSLVSTNRNNTERNSKCIDILLMGASDIRHIFLTLSEIRIKMAELSSSSVRIPKVRFFIYEPSLRIHARHLLFIQWITASMFSFSELEDRVSVFLEAYGNSMVRPVTAACIKEETKKVLRALGFAEGVLAPLVNFNEMKMKEKDFIENQMKQWVTDIGSDTKIEVNWAQRLRTEMADRFDNKDNIIDFDFNFSVLEHTHGIRFPEYRLWRNSGIAYDYCHINPRKGVTYDYTCPNKTLCFFQRTYGSKAQRVHIQQQQQQAMPPVDKNESDKSTTPYTTVPIGASQVQRGLDDFRTVGIYTGDIKNGPFFAFGIDTENTHLKKRNIEGQLKYGNGVMAMHNVRAWLYHLLSGGRRWPWADHTLAWDDPKNYNILPVGTPDEITYKAQLPEVEFHFVGLELEKLFLHRKMKKDQMAEQKKKKGKKMEDIKGCNNNNNVIRNITKEELGFDAAFVGANCVEMMSKDFFDNMSVDSAVVVETLKFVSDAKDEAKEYFLTKINEIMEINGGGICCSNSSDSQYSHNNSKGKPLWRKDHQATAELHANVPPLKRREVCPTKGQERADERYIMPYHIVYTRVDADRVTLTRKR